MQTKLEEDLLRPAVERATSGTAIPLDPHAVLDDPTQEVFTRSLIGFDREYQSDAPWSLERLVIAARANPSLVPTLLTSEVEAGAWTFYAMRAEVNGSDCIVVRKMNPTRYVRAEGKIVTMLIGDQLRLAKEPLLRFDLSADLVVIDDEVFVHKAKNVEALFVDAAAVKARAPQSVAAFVDGLPVQCESTAQDALTAVCQTNANVARRVERITRDGTGLSVTMDALREQLRAADFSEDYLGVSSVDFDHPDRALKLIDVLEDRFWRPRFAGGVRRASAWRSVSN